MAKPNPKHRRKPGKTGSVETGETGPQNPQNGFTPAQVEAADKARERSTQSTPTVVIDAFLPSRVMAGDVAFQPMTMSVIMALQRVGSGLLRADAHFSMSDIANALWIMITPIADVRAALAQEPQPGVFPAMARAVDAMTDSIPVNLIPKLGELLNARLVDAFKTAVPYGVDKSTGADGDFPAART